MKKRIDIDIGLDGELSIDAVGFQGPDCEQATAFLEEALGEVTETRKKPEYRRRGTVANRQSVGGGDGA